MAFELSLIKSVVFYADYVTHIPFVVEMSSVIENSKSVVTNGFPSDHSDADLSDIDREEKQRLIKQELRTEPRRTPLETSLVSSTYVITD
ncbi:hypothetical protein ACTXT7_013756 [Hymenolepis weldensis]